MQTGPRTSGGFLCMNAAASEVWIDEVYPVCGALAMWGRIVGRTDWVDEAYHQLLICGRRLIDPATGLARHRTPSVDTPAFRRGRKRNACGVGQG
ncbi:glycoside hydrolase family 88 protein [Planosporangium sp. 12N6]|uniref:glycoside hydrolase family 88 protein n=1 Tax=Planosporangium spinosum TaxID=3402278 RepID=UPI003CF72184